MLLHCRSFELTSGGMESMSLYEMMEIMDRRENWYALKVFFNRVFEIEKKFQQAGIESYIPTVYVTREVRGVKTRIRKTIIPSLMFFRSTEEYAVGLKDELRDRAFVYSNFEKKTGRCPVSIPDEEMRMFMLVTSSGDPGLEFFPNDCMSYKDGQKVRVTGGIFEGAEGEIKRIRHNRRLTVTLKGVCMVATSFISPELLEKIE